MARYAVLEATYSIDTTPNSAPTYVAIDGLEDISSSITEEVREGYFVGNGNGYSDVTAGRWNITLTGKRIVGDTAQDYIVSLLGSYGEDRKSTLQVTAPDGTVHEIPCTIELTSIMGGASADLDAFSCVIHSDGTWTTTAPTV